MKAHAISRIGSMTSVQVLLGTLLMIVCAEIRLPFYPIVMSLQTLGVILLAGMIGPKKAAASCLAYLALGAAGAPITSIPLWFMGRSAGYLLAFPVAAFLSGKMLERKWGFTGRFMIAYGIQLFILACGTAWLSFFVGFRLAVTGGFVVFLLGDLVKAVVVATVLPRIRRDLYA